MSKPGRKPGTPKTGGRRKGTPNVVTGNLRTFIAVVIDNNRAEMIKRLKRLDDKEYFQVIDRFMRYTLPQLSAVTKEIEVSSKIDQLNASQLDKLISKILDDPKIIDTDEKA